MLILSVLSFVFTPINQEYEDILGLNSARQTDGFAEAALLLEYRKLDPSPLEEFLLFHHPGGRTVWRAPTKRCRTPTATSTRTGGIYTGWKGGSVVVLFHAECDSIRRATQTGEPLDRAHSFANSNGKLGEAPGLGAWVPCETAESAGAKRFTTGAVWR